MRKKKKNRVNPLSFDVNDNLEGAQSEILIFGGGRGERPPKGTNLLKRAEDSRAKAFCCPARIV